MSKEIEELLRLATELATRYKLVTGKPLGITGEVAEFQAAKLLNLTLAPARTAGYDAEDGHGRRLQIKGRCVLAKMKRGARIGKLRLDTHWDVVLLVLLNEALEVISIHEAPRLYIETALLAPGSRARNERGALSIGSFLSLSSQVWPEKDDRA